MTVDGEEEYNTRDKLEIMFRMQQRLIEFIEDHHPDNWFLDKQLRERFEGSYIYDLCNFLITEAVELQNETQWKWWKIYDKGLDKKRVYDEIVDLLHVILHIAIEAGMSVDDLYNSYVEKNEVNLKRQLTKY